LVSWGHFGVDTLVLDLKGEVPTPKTIYHFHANHLQAPGGAAILSSESPSIYPAADQRSTEMRHFIYRATHKYFKTKIIL
jgi:hypothetical protein